MSCLRLILFILVSVALQMFVAVRPTMAQGMFSVSVYLDADADTAYIYGYVDTADYSNPGSCGHTEHQTFGWINGPTGYIERSYPGFSSSMWVPFGEGDFEIRGGLRLRCGCVGIVFPTTREVIRITVTVVTTGQYVAGRCVYYNYACSSGTPTCGDPLPIEVYNVPSCYPFARIRFGYFVGICSPVGLAQPASGPGHCT